MRKKSKFYFCMCYKIAVNINNGDTRDFWAKKHNVAASSVVSAINRLCGKNFLKIK